MKCQKVDGSRECPNEAEIYFIFKIPKNGEYHMAFCKLHFNHFNEKNHTIQISKEEYLTHLVLES